MGRAHFVKVDRGLSFFAFGPLLGPQYESHMDTPSSDWRKPKTAKASDMPSVRQFLLGSASDCSST